MTIIENSILHLSTLMFFLLGLGGLILGYLKKNHTFYNWAFGAIILGCLQSLFIAIVNGDVFVLSNRADYEANFVFTASTGLIAIISIWAIVVYYLHKVVPPMLVQMGLAFSSVIIVVTFSTSVSHQLNKRVAKSTQHTKFQKAEEFQKGSPNPEFSKLPSVKDSVTKQ